MMRRFTLFLLLIVVLSAPSLHARSWQSIHLLPEEAVFPVLGSHGFYRLGPQETLIELARRTGVGYKALVAANPNIDPWLPPEGRDVLLPYAAVLPSIHVGITVNLAEFRLYYIWREGGTTQVRIYPIGVGIEGRETPEREFTVTAKIENPAWTPPATLLKERPGHPTYVPPGPDNPLGEFWMQLAEGYGIHGTNRPFGVGRRVSQGCIRMYPEDIRDLFRRVPLGTPVRVIYQPIKVGFRDGNLMVEVHHDYLGRISNPLEEVLGLKNALGWKGAVDLSTLNMALREARGIPVPISTMDKESRRAKSGQVNKAEG